MTTKLLCIGDPHFKLDNMAEIDLFITRIVEIINEKQPDSVVILGDLLHTHERLQTLVLNKAQSFINIVRELKEVYIIVGNHDYINNSQFLSTNHWMNSMKYWDNVTIVDTVKYCTMNNKQFTFVPYVPVGRFKEALDTSDNDWKSSSIIFAHQEFFGCKMGSIISTDGDRWCTDLPQIISGHIHSKQQIQSNIYYTGSPIQHAFGESKNNTIALVTVDDNISIEEISLNLPLKRIIYIDSSNFEQYQLNPGKDKIKLTISGTYSEFKSIRKTKKYRNTIKKGIKIVFKPKNPPVSDENNSNVNETNFTEILRKLVYEIKDNELHNTYERLIK